MLARIKRLLIDYWFFFGVVVAVALAYQIPETGRFVEKYHGTSTAIFVIFLLSGVTVPLKHLNEDLKCWRCHALIHGFTFCLIPTLVYLTTLSWMQPTSVRSGVFVLAVLPTTISSCVIYTTLAGGRTSCALLNAVGGNLIGIIVSPLLLGVLLGYRGHEIFAKAGEAVLKLGLLAVLPFIIGQILRLAFPTLPNNIGLRKVHPYLAQILILVIIHCAFCQALERLLENLTALWKSFLYLTFLHIFLVEIAVIAARALRLPSAYATVVLFCASQKTLALGVPIATAFFPGEERGLVLAPVIFYHIFQLGFGSFLIPRLAKQNASHHQGI